MRWIVMAFLFWGATAAQAQWTLEFRKVTAALPGGAEFIEREAKLGDDTVRVQGVFFSAKQGRFTVVDNAASIPLSEAAKSAGALAGANGAFFKADWTPVGLEIAGGRKVHGFERAKILSGIFVVTDGAPRIVRSERYTASSKDTDALQCGPFLVEHGAIIPGLNATRRARRTVVATDGRGRWALLTISPLTLADAGALLASRTVFPDFEIATALNLDGGPSTGIWVAAGPRPFYAPERGTVRNFLMILPR